MIQSRLTSVFAVPVLGEAVLYVYFYHPTMYRADGVDGPPEMERS